MRTNKINEYERVDDLHRNSYKIIQDPKRFCFGIDAVLLSGFARVKKGERVLDLGTGTGIIPILLEAKTMGAHFTGLEIQEESAEMAKRSIALNELEEKIDIILGDIKEASNFFADKNFDVVTSNPPYMNEGGGLINPHSAKAIARHEVLCSLEDVVVAAGKVLRVGGRFYMIHRPHRLTDIMVFFRQYKLEPKRLRFIQPFQDKAPTMVLIEGVKGGNPGIKVEPPLIVYSEPGKYTQEVYDIYYGEGQA